MRDWELRVDEIADPVPGPGQVLTKVLACGICGSDLHMLRYGAELRRLSQELEAELPPDPMRPIPFDRYRHGDGSRVLLRGRRARTGREQPHTRPSRRQHAGRVRQRRHPRRRVLEPLPGRLRRATGAQRAVGDPRPQRCAALPCGDDGATRGGHPHGEQEWDWPGRARRSCWGWDRSAWHVSPSSRCAASDR